MNKEKAKVAFEKYLETLDTFPAYQYDTMLKAKNAYLAGAEWAWGEALKRSNETAERDGGEKRSNETAERDGGEKRPSLKECFGDPNYVLETMSEFVKDGDFASFTDLIASYVQSSTRYSGQEDFAKKIGTSRSTFSRMLRHSNVSLDVFFDALEQIYEDANS